MTVAKRSATDEEYWYAGRRADRVPCPKQCGADVYRGFESDPPLTCTVSVNVHPISVRTASFLLINDRPLYYLDFARCLWRLDSVPRDELMQRRLLAHHYCQGAAA